MLCDHRQIPEFSSRAPPHSNQKLGAVMSQRETTYSEYLLLEYLLMGKSPRIGSGVGTRAKPFVLLAFLDCLARKSAPPPPPPLLQGPSSPFHHADHVRPQVLYCTLTQSFSTSGLNGKVDLASCIALVTTGRSYLHFTTRS